MEKSGKVLFFLFCLLASSTCVQAATPPSEPENSTTSGDIRFRLVHSSLVLATGSLNGLQGRNLLIDTGTNPTVLDAGIAKKLGLIGGPEDLRTLAGPIQGKKAVLSRLKLGPITADSVPVLVADLSFIKKEVGERVDAVIGLDVLRGGSFTIDYESHRICFGPATSYKNWVPFTAGPPLITVTMQIDGVSKEILVDTGAEGLFLFENPRAQRRVALIPSQANAFNVSLTRGRQQAEVQDLRLGSLERTRQPAYLVRLPDVSVLEFDGLLGPPALGIRQLVFDFQRMRLGWN